MKEAANLKKCDSYSYTKSSVHLTLNYRCGLPHTGAGFLPQEQDFRRGDHIPSRQLVAPGHFPTAGCQGPPYITTCKRFIKSPHYPCHSAFGAHEIDQILLHDWTLAARWWPGLLTRTACSKVTCRQIKAQQHIWKPTRTGAHAINYPEPCSQRMFEVFERLHVLPNQWCSTFEVLACNVTKHFLCVEEEAATPWAETIRRHQALQYSKMVPDARHACCTNLNV